MHTNLRKTKLKHKKRQQYRWRMQPWKPPRSWKHFRAAEDRCINQIAQGEDPDNVVWPTDLTHVREYDPWFYD